MTIRQTELERLKRLIQEKDQALDKYLALRAELLERYVEGAAVEPGPWDLSVKENEYRRFTEEQVERILGVREAERVKGLLTPKKHTTVTVIKASPGGAR